MIIRIKGVKRVRGRQGELYLYHRATGKRLLSEPGTVALAEEVAQLDRDVAAVKADPTLSAPKPSDGTLGGIIHAYRASPEFTGLGERTKADYQKVFDYLQPLVAVRLEGITAAWVLSLRDRAYKSRKRRFANYVVQVVRLLFTWGRPREWIKVNPALDTPLIRRPKKMARANRPWTDEERSAVLDAAKGGVRVVIALGIYGALREGDAIRFPRSGYDGTAIEWTQGKTGEAIWLPAHSRLREILDATPVSSPIFAIGQRGAAFTESGFRASFFKLLGRMKSEGKVGDGLTFHGLRHTLGKTLAEAGCDSRTIAAVLGHKTETMARHYADAEDRKRRVVVAMKRVEKTRSAQVAENETGSGFGKQTGSEMENKSRPKTTRN